MLKNRIAKEYLTVKELSVFSGISERTLRDLLKDPVNPIPSFRIGPAGRIVRIKKSEFDEWMLSQRAQQELDLDDLVNEIL